MKNKQTIRYKELLFFFGLILYSLLNLPYVAMAQKPIDTQPTFEVYFLKDATLVGEKVQKKSLDELELSSTPWLSNSDIAFYDFSTHYIYLTRSKRDIFKHFQGMLNHILDSSWWSKPFVVVVNGKRCYLGEFHSVASSQLQQLPYIDELGLTASPDDVLPLFHTWQGEDLRNHRQVEEGLRELGLYRAGITLTLEHINPRDGSYRFTLHNNESKSLWVFDPEKAGTGIFHYYTNGLQCFNWAKKQSVNLNIPSKTPQESFNPEWYTEIKPHQTIMREIVTGQRIPIGEYTCRFFYSGPIEIDRRARIMANGRIWMGTISIKRTSFIVHK